MSEVLVLPRADPNHKCEEETSSEVSCHLSVLPTANPQHKLYLFFSHRGEQSFFTFPLPFNVSLLVSFSISTFSQYLLWWSYPWSVMTNIKRRGCPSTSKSQWAPRSRGGCWWVSRLPGPIRRVVSCRRIGWVALVLLVRRVPGSHVHVVTLVVHVLFGFLLW